MLLIIPATSPILPASYLPSQPYEHYFNHNYHSHHHAPRFAVPSYPSRVDFLRQPSAEELEEREYRQALEIIANHRRRQAEEQAAIRRQQLAETARQRYFAALAAELEQRRQEELLAARRSELIRAQRARERLVAAERQHAIDAFLRQLNAPQLVCDFRIHVTCTLLIDFCPQLTRQPHVTKRKPLVDKLKQRLGTETDTDIADTIKSILPSLEPRSIESERPKELNKGTSEPSEEEANVIESLLSSIFPGLVRVQPRPSSPAEKPQSSVSDKGKGKSRAVADEASQKPAPKSKPADKASAEIPRHIMDPSKRTRTPSPDEAGPSKPSPPSPSTEPIITESEQVQIGRTVALSSIQNVQNTLTKLQAGFVLPTELDHHTPSTDDRDETASISSVSSDLTKLIPFTNTNKPVYKYENELNGLLDELDRIDSHGDAEVREKRKEAVKAIEKALESVEQVVSEAVEKRLSLVSSAPAGDEPFKGHDAEEDLAEGVAPAREQVDTPAVDDAPVVESSTPAQAEDAVVIPAEVPSPAEETPLESDIPIARETPADSASTETDVGASTEAIAPAPVEPDPATETASAEPQVEADALETVDTFLLTEKTSPPSPAQKPQEADNDSDDDDDVLSLDSDPEKSDWSEIEH